jgi:hypothetical protein
MTPVPDILMAFERIGLGEVENIGQLRRIETKFLLPFHSLPVFLEAMQPHYKVLAIKNSLVFGYRSQYYDTAGFDSYLAHHNGKQNRYKIRERSYLETGKTYLEVKFSSNTQRIFKYRIRQELPGQLFQDPAAGFIRSNSPFDPGLLLPVLTVGYNRLTLVNTGTGERLTLDTELEFCHGVSRLKISTFAVVEVKQPDKMSSPALQFMRNNSVRPRNFSKYCLGVNYLYPALKKNNFKKKLIELTRLIHDPSVNLVAGI